MLSNAIPETWYAGSLVLYRMLDGYPADRLMVVGPRPQQRSRILSCEYRHVPLPRSTRLDTTRLAQAKRSLQSICRVGRIADADVDRAIGAFAPEVVLTVMEQRDYLDAAHRLCQRRGLPLAVIVHDRLEAFERVYPPFRKAQQRGLAAIYRSAAARLCVSPEMEQRLRVDYGAPGTVLYPSRSEDLAPRPPAESEQLKDPPHLTLGYAGSLSYGYGDRIRELMPELAASGVRLRLFSRDVAGSDVAGVTQAGARQPAEVWALVKQHCDAVWLPYAQGPEHRSLYETHFPSKLTEYLALGMPVLVTGPDYATGVTWAARHPDAVLTVANDSIESVREATRRLRDEPALRTQLAAAAPAAGDADFDPAAIRRRFLSTLREIGHAARAERH